MTRTAMSSVSSVGTIRTRCVACRYGARLGHTHYTRQTPFGSLSPHYFNGAGRLIFGQHKNTAQYAGIHSMSSRYAESSRVGHVSPERI